MLHLKTVILYAIAATLLAKSQTAPNNDIASISNPIYLITQRYELYINNATKNYMNTEWETKYEENKIIACTVHQPLLCIYAEPPQETQQQQQEPSTLLIIHDEILNDFHDDRHWHTIKYIFPMDTNENDTQLPPSGHRRMLFLGKLLRGIKRKARRAINFGRRAARRAASIARRARSAVRGVVGRGRRRRPRRRRRARSRPQIRGPRGARGPRGRRGRSGVPIIRGFIRTVKRKLRRLRRRNKRRLCQMQAGPCSGGMGMGMGMGMNPMMNPMMNQMAPPMVGQPVTMLPHPVVPHPMMNGHPMGMMPNPMMPPKIEIKTEVHKHGRRLMETEDIEFEGFVAEKCVLNEEVEICLWYDMEDGKVLVDYTQIKGAGDWVKGEDEVDYVEKFEWMVAKKMVMAEQIDECQDGLPEEISFDAICVRKWSGDESESDVRLMVKDGVKEMEFSLIDDKDWNEIYFVNEDGQKLCRFVSGSRLCVEFTIDIEFNAIKEIKSISIEHSLWHII